LDREMKCTLQKFDPVMLNESMENKSGEIYAQSLIWLAARNFFG